MKKIIVLPLLIMAILVNMIPMSSGAYASQIDLKNHVNILYNAAKTRYSFNYGKYENVVIFYYDGGSFDRIQTIEYANGSIASFSDNIIKFSDNNYSDYYYEGSPLGMRESDGWLIMNNSGGGSGNKQVDLHYTPDFIYTNDYDTWKDYFTLSDENVVGGIPLQESDIKVIYYQSVNDKSQNFSITNNSDRDIYTSYDLYAVTGDEQGKTYEHILYKYYQKELINSSEELQVVYMKYTGLKTYYLLVSDNPNYNAPASWLAGFFKDKNVFPDENAAMEASGSTDYFAKLLANYSVWFNKAVLCDGNIQAAYDIVFDNYSGNYDPNSKLDLGAQYPVTLYQDDVDVPLHNLYYSYSNKILVPAGQQITVSIPSKYLQIQENYRYAWDVCYAAKLDDPFYSHTKKYFTADFTSTYEADPNYIYGTGGSVTDIDDNVVGEYDENGDLYIDEDSNNKFVTDEDDGNNATFENTDVKQVKTLWGKAQEFVLFFNDAMGVIPGWCKSLFADIFVLVCIKILIKFLSA